MVFSKWLAGGSEDFPSCSPFHSPGEFSISVLDVGFTFVAAFASVFYNVSIEIVGFSGVDPSTFFTNRVVREPGFLERFSSVLVEDGSYFIVLFKGDSDGFQIISIFIHVET